MAVGRPRAAADVLATVPDDPRATEEVRLRAAVEVATGAVGAAIARLAAHCADAAPCGPALRDLVDLALGEERFAVAAGAVEGRVPTLLAAGTVEAAQVAVLIAGLFAAGDGARADRLAREAGPEVLAGRPVLAARLARIRGIGADLRLVDTRTLEVVRTVSSQKQIVGWEVSADLFRFFGDKLVDVNAGRKSLEPLHLGVRTVLERQVLELVGAALGLDTGPCTDAVEARWFEPVPAPALPSGLST